MSKQIHFDSIDWGSIVDTIKKINEIGCMQVGNTDEGESILFNVSRYEDEDILVTEILQSNGWVCIQHYYPAERIIETTYRKEN